MKEINKKIDLSQYNKRELLFVIDEFDEHKKVMDILSHNGFIVFKSVRANATKKYKNTFNYIFKNLRGI